MHKLMKTAMILLLLSVPSLASAALIDFEAYADAQNLNGINLGGVTVTNPTGVVEVFDDRFGLAYHSATKAIGSFAEPAESVNPMIFTFDAVQTLVSLWAGDGGNDTDNWTLNAYDAAVGGALVATANSGNWNGFPYTQLIVNAPTIWRVEAIWNGPDCCGIGFDDLEFEGVPVPEPATVALLGLGLAALGFRSRRRVR